MESRNISMINFYSKLGVPESAFPEEIKRAYHKLAKKYHPDKNNGCKKAEEQFKEVKAAYDVLSVTSKRAQYDLALLQHRQSVKQAADRARKQEENRNSQHQKQTQRPNNHKHPSPDRIPAVAFAAILVVLLLVPLFIYAFTENGSDKHIS